MVPFLIRGIVIIKVLNSLPFIRMTKLPPGFTHELRQHLSQNPPVDEVTGVPFVDLENYCCGKSRRFSSYGIALSADNVQGHMGSPL